jgi:hypothetical protein
VAVSLRFMWRFSTSPVTARPKIGSGASMECPPASGIPASSHTAAAANHFPGNFRRQHIDRPAEDGDGHQRVAAHGVDVADGIGGGDAAEIEGSSTIGMKKSVVDTTPRSSSMAYTAASSREALPTQFRVQVLRPAAGENHFQHLGEILQPQPAPWLYWVRRIGSLMGSLAVDGADSSRARAGRFLR